MPNQFQPSSESLTAAERTLAALKYAKRAAEMLEKHVTEHGELPSWASERVVQSAQHLGMAVSYARKEQLNPGTKTKSKKRSKP